MLHCGSFRLSLSRPLVMGIVNVTPDSFSDGGQHATTSAAVEHALHLIDEGADILDIGGESTRPGAMPASTEEELRRVIPVIEALRGKDIPLSVDTCKPEVMREALAAGADMINDVNALHAPGALEVLAESQAAICFMHMRGEPRNMQAAPEYQDVVGEVSTFLAERLATAQALGITRERLVVDPGFGFGKNLEHNLELLRHLECFAKLGVPLLAGMSRKSMLGSITGLPVGERLIPSVTAAVLAALKGAKILRVHDVRETRQALQVVAAIEETN
ncbi:MAG: dihydropteroate synthase [Sulfuricella sp.]|nr:dihydropteroate synthase [Sulfuricella sp.]